MKKNEKRAADKNKKKLTKNKQTNKQTNKKRKRKDYRLMKLAEQCMPIYNIFRMYYKAVFSPLNIMVWFDFDDLF